MDDDRHSCSSSSADGSESLVMGGYISIEDLTREREDRLVQWLHALDVQVVGACRADERLKPMFMSNSMGGLAEDRLLAHLNQHFDPAEVGMLARCFCIPLVSLRVGMIEKQGTILLPNSVRGNLNVMVLPSSDMRLVYVGDDGITEQLVTVGDKPHCHAVSLEEISEDPSGRSFHIKVSDGRNLYYWCADKSKLLGTELFYKMKDILERKPSISDISGIDQLRLDCFATHLHTYLVGSNATGVTESGCSARSTTVSSKSFRSRHDKSHSTYQGSLSPKSSSFKEGPSRNLSTLRNAARDKLKRRNDGILSAVDSLMAVQIRVEGASEDHEKVSQQLTPNFIEKLSLPKSETFVSSVSFTPCYCWCPQGDVIHPSFADSLSLSSALFTPPSLAISFSSTTPFDFPEAIGRLPLPVSQQVPAFTPQICDPIVHIPVIDVCSSGQGYLVSAGPANPPLLPKLVASEAESVMEQGARETLRLLISSASHSNSLAVNVSTPSIYSMNCNVISAVESEDTLNSCEDVDALANGVAAMGLVDEEDVIESVAMSSTVDKN